MKKILHITEYLFQGGIERLLDQIAKHTPKESAELVFYAYQAPTLEGIGKELEQRGFPLYTYDKRQGFDFALLKQLIRVVKKHRVQTIHSHDFGPMEYAVALKLRFPRLQLIHSHHSLHYFLRFPKYVRFFQVFGLFYDKIICVSDYVKEVLSERCPLVRRKLTTIYNGVDVDSFAEGETVTPRAPLRLVSVCRISPEKNLVHVLDACRQLRDAGTDFVLHHAGSGDATEEGKLNDYVRQHELGDKVIFHGFQSDVREVFKLGDIFISSSFTEGHPVAVLEAMASGKLCLCSNIRPHQLISSEAIVLYDLTDDSLFQRLAEIPRNLERFRAIPAMGRKVVRQRFSLGQMIHSYLALYT